MMPYGPNEARRIDIDRLMPRAREFKALYPEFSLVDCLVMAEMERHLLWGTDGVIETPVGILAGGTR